MLCIEETKESAYGGAGDHGLEGQVRGSKPVYHHGPDASPIYREKACRRPESLIVVDQALQVYDADRFAYGGAHLRYAVWMVAPRWA